jgi:hypothetical protein
MVGGALAMGFAADRLAIVNRFSGILRMPVRWHA